MTLLPIAGEIISYTPQHYLDDETITEKPVYEIKVPTIAQKKINSKRILDEAGESPTREQFANALRAELLPLIDEDQRDLCAALITDIEENGVTPRTQEIHETAYMDCPRYRKLVNFAKNSQGQFMLMIVRLYVCGWKNLPVEFTQKNNMIPEESIMELVGKAPKDLGPLSVEVLQMLNPTLDLKKNLSSSPPAAA